MKQISTMMGVAMAATSLVPTGAQAETREGFEAGIELFDYKYREQSDGETIVYDDGTFTGIHVAYVETIGSGLFLRAKLSAARGSVDYRSPDPAGEVRLDDVSQSIGQFDMQIGTDLPVGGGITVSPFTGLGARVLIDESGGKFSDNGFAGYDREIGFGYLPVGAALRLPISGAGTALLMSAQYNVIVTGTARSNFSGLDPELPDVELDLDGGSGIEASATLQLPIGKRAVNVGPFLRHWDLNRSRSSTLANPENQAEAIEFFEPRNRTSEIGLRLSFAF
jgi:hypothetical protein